MMKRITAILLILNLALLCWGCHEESRNTPDAPQIRYENGTAVYTQPGGDYTMELRFEQPVVAGSEISLLLEEQEVLGFTTQAAVSHLQISSPELALNRPYTLRVNGKIQRHRLETEEREFPQPGDIPEPSLPTIPVEPMGEIVTTAPQDSGEKEPFSFDNPPTVGFDSDVALGEIPALLPSSNNGEGDPMDSGGILPVEPFTPHDQDGNGLENGIPQLSSQRKSNTFILTEKITIFVAVGDAT